MNGADVDVRGRKGELHFILWLQCGDFEMVSGCYSMQADVMPGLTLVGLRYTTVSTRFPTSVIPNIYHRCLIRAVLRGPVVHAKWVLFSVRPGEPAIHVNDGSTYGPNQATIGRYWND